MKQEAQEVSIELDSLHIRVTAPVVVAIDQCLACGTLWRLFSDDTYSLVPGMRPESCCDNVSMVDVDLRRVYPI